MNVYKNITDEEKPDLNSKIITKNQLTNKLILPLIKKNDELNKKLEDLNYPNTTESLQIKLRKLKKFKNKRKNLITEGILIYYIPKTLNSFYILIKN